MLAIGRWFCPQKGSVGIHIQKRVGGFRLAVYQRFVVDRDSVLSTQSWGRCLKNDKDWRRFSLQRSQIQRSLGPQKGTHVQGNMARQRRHFINECFEPLLNLTMFTSTYPSQHRDLILYIAMCHAYPFSTLSILYHVLCPIALWIQHHLIHLGHLMRATPIMGK